MKAIRYDDFGPGRRFQYEVDYQEWESWPEWKAVNQANYLSTLVNEDLSAYVQKPVDQARSTECRW
jgi:hypothetical protein